MNNATSEGPSHGPDGGSASLPSASPRHFLALIIPVCLLAFYLQDPHPPTPHRHPEAQKLKNPVTPDAASIEEGRKLYLRHCASCHGAGGKGDGSMALAGGTPANLVDETWDHGSTDGEIFVVIRDGSSSDMEGYKEKLSDKQIWQIVNYLRSIGAKK
jgi:mono/diheme cytochrome c family protein